MRSERACCSSMMRDRRLLSTSLNRSYCSQTTTFASALTFRTWSQGRFGMSRENGESSRKAILAPFESRTRAMRIYHGAQQNFPDGARRLKFFLLPFSTPSAVALTEKTAVVGQPRNIPPVSESWISSNNVSQLCRTLDVPLRGIGVGSGCSRSVAMLCA